MKSKNQHRRVNSHDSTDHILESPAIEAIAAAENEGWPIARASSEDLTVAHELLRAELAPAVLRR